jgi:hypothetical protein
VRPRVLGAAHGAAGVEEAHEMRPRDRGLDEEEPQLAGGTGERRRLRCRAHRGSATAGHLDGRDVGAGHAVDHADLRPPAAADVAGAFDRVAEGRQDRHVVARPVVGLRLTVAQRKGEAELAATDRGDDALARCRGAHHHDRLRRRNGDREGGEDDDEGAPGPVHIAEQPPVRAAPLDS